MQPVVTLGIDAGSSSTRWHATWYAGGLDQPATRHAEGRSEPLSALAFLPTQSAPTAQVEQLLHDVLQGCGVPSDAGSDLALSLTIGMTGLSDATGLAQRIEDVIRAAAPTPTVYVELMNDMALAYRACLAPGAGLLLYAGTGSIAVHQDVSLILHRAGGHGYRIDDAGGGFWMGRQALRHALRKGDETGTMPHDAYHDALYAAMGGDDWPTIKTWAYEAGRDRIASLARLVIEHADQAPEAGAITREAARELVALAQRLRYRVGTTRWIASGGLLQGPHALTRALEEAKPADVDLAFHPDAYAGAAETLAKANARAWLHSA